MDPRGALRAQLEGPDPGLASGQFANLLSGAAAFGQFRDFAMQRRKAQGQDDGAKKAIIQQIGELTRADATAQVQWAITTRQSFRERLVWFWANHFSTSAEQNQAGPLIGPLLREAIRPHVTGNFTNLLLAVERHPAMLRYLQNDVSVGPNSPAGIRSKKGLNENLGRECMELHTVGLKAGYTQTDVTNMAKILTGWSVAPPEQASDSTGFKFRPLAHEPGAQTLLGHEFSGGEEAGIAALTFLATYPTTYQLIATKLVTHFIADNPSADAVSRVAMALRESGGDLTAAYMRLIESPDAWTPGQKLKTPFEFVLSTFRALPTPPDQPPAKPMDMMSALGQPVWGAPLPDGWPDQAEAWSGSAAMLSRVDWAYTYSGRFENTVTEPREIANAALGTLLHPATASAMAAAGSRREALTLLLTSPEFQRR